MSSKKPRRKKNNNRLRFERNSRATLSLNRVAVVNLMPADRQGLIDWKTGRNVDPSSYAVAAVLEVAHDWTVYLATFCASQDGTRYMKSQEIALPGRYKADALCEQIEEAEQADGTVLFQRTPGVIEQYSEALFDTCNPAHVVGWGWIANPSGASLTEQQADQVFEWVGAWDGNQAEGDGDAETLCPYCLSPLSTLP